MDDITAFSQAMNNTLSRTAIVRNSTMVVSRLMIALAVSSSLLSLPAHAETFFANRTDWETAVGGTFFTEDFNALAAPTILAAGLNSAGLIDIELTGINGDGSYNKIDVGSGFGNIDGTTYYQGGSSVDGADLITVHFPQPLIAFGADWRTTHSAGGLTLRIGSSEFEFVDLLPSGVGSGFLGVVCTSPFATVDLFDASVNETFGMDNLSFVPEPSSIVLAALGLLGLIGFAWRAGATAGLSSSADLGRYGVADDARAAGRMPG